VRQFPRSLIVLCCALVAACGTPKSPIGPSPALVATPDQTYPLETGTDPSPDRVEEGGGGGGGLCSTEIPCTDVSLISGDANLSGIGRFFATSSALNFSSQADLTTHPGHSGRSDNVGTGGHVPRATIDLVVASGLANVLVTMPSPSANSELTASGTEPAVQTTSPCGSSLTMKVTTRVTIQLQYLGKTNITDIHSAACTP
jgi:hypothetical protein